MKKNYSFLTALSVILFSQAFAQPTIGTEAFAIVSSTQIASAGACIPPKTGTINGWAFTVSSFSNCGLQWGGQTAGSDGHVNFQNSGTDGGMQYGIIQSNDGSEFKLNNLTMGSNSGLWNGVAFSFVGYKNGSAVSGATVTGIMGSGGFTNSVSVQFTANTAFNDIDQINVVPVSNVNAIWALCDITIASPVAACTTPTLSVASSSNVLCNGGSTGSCTMTASGGSGFTYTWFPSGGNATIATGLSAGTYTCATTNSCGATDQETITITQPALALATSTAITNALCNGANGSATVTATGGTSPYTYTWSSGPTTSVEPTLLAGTYTVRVTDANSCIKVSTVVIGEPSALVTSTAMTSPLCNGQNGSATVTASGGTGAYSYTWSSGPTTSVEPTLLAGTYTVRVTDANSCSSTKSVTVTQPSAIGTSTGYTNVFCNGGVGSASILASGGTSPYTYTWSTGATGTFIVNQPAGSYTVKAIDANNCSSATRTITISQPAALVTTTAITDPLCNGGQGSATSPLLAEPGPILIPGKVALQLQ